MSMIQVIYISEVNLPVPPHQLERMLDKCRANNRAKGISGLLIRDHGAFLQVLEGPRPEIETLMGRIESDGRHSEMRVLQVAAITARQFDDSPLGYVDASRRKCLPEPYLRLRPLLRQRTIGRLQAQDVLALFSSGSAWSPRAGMVVHDARHAGQPAT